MYKKNGIFMVISVYSNTGEYKWSVVNVWTCRSIHSRPIPLGREYTWYVRFNTIPPCSLP